MHLTKRAKLLFLLAAFFSLTLAAGDEIADNTHFYYPPGYKVGDHSNYIHTKYNLDGFTTGNLESHIDLSKLTQFSINDQRALPHPEPTTKGKSDAEIDLMRKNKLDKLTDLAIWMEAAQPILLPNLFGYINYTIYKPQYPGYYDYIAQRAAFYSIAGKA